MKKALPKGKAIYLEENFDVHVRAKTLMKKLISKGEYLKHIEFKPIDSEDLFTPPENVTGDIFGDDVECAKEVYLSYMNDDKNSFLLFEYFEKLASVDRGFTYNISISTEGNMLCPCPTSTPSHPCPTLICYIKSEN